MVRPASETCYVISGTDLMSLGVPSKLKGCVPKVDRYRPFIVVRGEGGLHNV